MPTRHKKHARNKPPRRREVRPSPSHPPPAPDADIIDMQQAIDLLQTSQPTFYRWLREGKIKGMKVGRQWRFYRQDIERFMKGQGPRIDLPADIDPLLDQLARLVKQQGVEPPADPDDQQNKLPAAVQRLIRLGIAMRASDIHIDPPTQPGQGDVPVRLRLDGILRPVLSFDARLLPAVVEQLKVMAALDPHERTRPQDGRILSGESADVELRASFVPALLGEAVTLRLLPAQNLVFNLERLGFAASDLQRMKQALQQPWGLIICSGPTGSGKTTVLYAFFGEKITPELKTMSVEDPVEYTFPGAIQAQVRPEAGVTFSTILRSFARSDPDVVMVGEVRDAEVMALCQQLALTGHLVLTSLHTEDAASALRRMVDISRQPALVGDSTRIVVAQRLVRRLCPECSVEQEPERTLIEQAMRLARTGGMSWEALPKRFRAARGCPKCNQMGYRGRRVIAEVLEMTDQLAAALRRGAAVEELRTMAVGQGMTTIAADGIRRAAEGETTIEEVLRVIPRPG